MQELTALHGGTVAVESEPGRGSTFTIAIPFGSAHLPAQAADARQDELPPAMRARAFVEEALRWLPGAKRLKVPGLWMSRR